MADDGAFLELVQLVEAGRKVRGRDSLDILDEDVERAKDIDLVASGHNAEAEAPSHRHHLCPQCQSIHQDRVNLREKMRSQGQEFPQGLLN